MGCEICRHCQIDMDVITADIHWCPNCGKISSKLRADILPAMSVIIFDAKALVDTKAQRYERPRLKIVS